MATVTILKTEYQRLVDRALRYEYLRQLMEGDIFAPPPTRKAKEVIKALRKTGLYNKGFLKSIEKGLGRSSHFKA
ncbi:hypothetical protein KJ616_00015 [Patescibacteria group bacterium]|nr:hypothetical protein [Patescibacteria group bacterium]